MNKSILGYAAILFVIILIFAGCGQIDGDTSKISQNDHQKVYSDVTFSNNSFETGITDIASSKLKIITRGMSYKSIIKLLGDTNDYGVVGLRVYSVDNKKLLVLRFDSLEQICEKSGEELLKTAVPLIMPGEVVKLVEHKQNSKYGLLLTDGLFFCFETQDCFSLWYNKATITDKTGTALNIDSVEPISYLFIQYSSMMETYPAILNCTSVVLFNN